MIINFIFFMIRDKLKLYNALYSYRSGYDGDIFHVSRNLWTVVGKNKEEARKIFWDTKDSIEESINDKPGANREVSSLDALIEIKVPGYKISVDKDKIKNSF